LPDETLHWLRQFVFLFLVAGFVQTLMSVSGVVLGWGAGSPALVVFGLDAGLGALREFALAIRLGRRTIPDLPPPTGSRVLPAAYIGVGLFAFVSGAQSLWRGLASAPTLLGIGLAALSVLLVPIVGSYMKAVAIELKSAALKAAAVFTFSNSYLAMVLLISLLIRTGMERGWGDAVGALVMAPFILQKGIQILIEGREPPAGTDAGL
jgi:Cation efflux family